MGNFFSYQNSGDEIVTAEQAGLPTKENPNGLVPVSQAVRPNAHAHSFRMQQGAEAAGDQHIVDANEKVALFIDELDRIEVLRASGESIDSAKRAFIKGTMTDISIAAVDRGGVSIDDPVLEGLRARVGQLIGK